MNKIIVNGKCICRRTISLHSFQYQMTCDGHEMTNERIHRWKRSSQSVRQAEMRDDTRIMSQPRKATKMRAARFQNMWTATRRKRKINYWHMSRMNLLRMAFYTRKNTNKKTVIIVIANDMREIHADTHTLRHFVATMTAPATNFMLLLYEAKNIHTILYWVENNVAFSSDFVEFYEFSVRFLCATFAHIAHTRQLKQRSRQIWISQKQFLSCIFLSLSLSIP